MWNLLKDVLGTHYHTNDTHTMAKQTSSKKIAAAKKSAPKAAKKTVKSTKSEKTAKSKKSAGVKKRAKATEKKGSKKPLVKAENEKQFYAANGAVLSTLNDLLEELSRMDEDAFYCHVRGGQNDFACWVNDVLCDEECAKAILEAEGKPQTVTILKTTLKTYDV